MLRSQKPCAAAGCLVRNPFGLPGSRCNLPVEARCCLSRYERYAGSLEFHVHFVQGRCLRRAQTAKDRQPVPAQQPRASSCDERVGVFHGVENLANSCLQDGIRTGRCPPMVAAGFERDEEHSATRFQAGVSQGFNLCMVGASPVVEPLSHNSTVANNHAANPRIGIGHGGAPARQPQRHAHVEFRRPWWGL